MQTTRKPSARQVMASIIDQARSSVPFDIPPAQLCDGVCRGCAKKLLDFFDAELCAWQDELDEGLIPTLGDIQKRSKMATKLYQGLKKNGLVK